MKRSFLTTLIFVVCCHYGLAQSQRSDELFARGVDLYQEGHYWEAISVFTLCDSLDNAEMDSTNNRRSYAAHWLASSLYHMGDTARAAATTPEYELPPVDRRLTVRSDSVDLLVRTYLERRDLPNALSTLQLMLSLEEQELGVDTWFTTGTRFNMAYVLTSMGRGAEAVAIIDSMLTVVRERYGEQSYVARVCTKDALSLYAQAGDGQRVANTAEYLLRLVSEQAPPDDACTEETLELLSAFFAQSGQLQLLDAVTERQCRLVGRKYGERSLEMGRLWRSIGQFNMHLNRLTEAGIWTERARSLLADIEGNSSEDCMLAMMQLATIQMAQQNFKDARRTLKDCLREARRMEPGEAQAYATSGCLSMLVMIQGLEKGKMDRGLIDECRSLVSAIEQQQGADSEVSLNASMIVAQLLMMDGQTHEAAAMADRRLDACDRLGQFKLLFSSCIVFLQDGQYVKARKASSRALDNLSRELVSRQFATATSSENKSNIDNGLRIIEAIGISPFASGYDTLSYSLGMIKQDLLMASLLIQEHTDSLGTEQFMQTLYQFAKTTTDLTRDEVMADSIMGRYQRKLNDTFGPQSPQSREAALLLDRCRFESTDGRSAYLTMELAKDGPQYAEKKRAYDESFAQWLQNRGEAVEEAVAPQPTIPTLPQMKDIVQGRLFAEGLDSCKAVLFYYTEQPDSPDKYLRQITDAMSAMCVYADSLGIRDVTFDSIKLLALMLPACDEETDISQRIIPILRLAWIHLDEAQYEEVEQTLLPIIDDPADQLRAATMLDVIDWLSDYSSSVLDKRSVTARALPALDARIREIADEETRMKYFILRTNRLWSRYYDYRIDSRDQLADDFILIMNYLESVPQLLAYKESYNALTMLCDITTDYRRKDSQLAVKADQMRKAAKQACISDTQERSKTLGINLSSWPSFSPLGTTFKLYFAAGDYIGDKEQLDVRLQLAYYDCNLNPREGNETAVQEVRTEWNEIRMLQQDGGYHDNLAPKVEHLARLAASKLNSKPTPEMCRLAYDIALFTKGYMLRSEQQLHRVIQQSGNRTVLQRFEEYMVTQQQLDNTTLSDSERTRLRSRASSLWSTLRIESQAFDDYSRSLECSWRDVQARLGSDEATIEFVNDGEQYYALVLRKGYDAPLATHVGWEDRWRDNDSLLTIKGKYSSPWPFFVSTGDSINPYIHPLEGVRTIYASPTGILHQTAIESIYDLYTDSLMSEKYNIYRLSSTRDLIEQRQTGSERRKAMLFGGIEYSLDENDWQLAAASRKSEGQLTAMRDMPTLSRGAMASVLTPLYGSLNEVEQIAAICQHSGITASSLTGIEAMEEKVKSISGSYDIAILHIATHGFYQPKEAAIDPTPVTFLSDDDSQENNALSRCGLLLAGAAALFEGQTIPDNVDDGILTAREISHLDYTSLDLVVLSACETALGDITGDGVFGLQRGFKKAGAQSILMSLWKVDDEATCLLMTEFYRNWIAGKMTKHDALEQAKQTVRSHKEKGWDDPKYWAAFILLDALD